MKISISFQYLSGFPSLSRLVLLLFSALASVFSAKSYVYMHAYLINFNFNEEKPPPSLPPLQQRVIYQNYWNFLYFSIHLSEFIWSTFRIGRMERMKNQGVVIYTVKMLLLKCLVQLLDTMHSVRLIHVRHFMPSVCPTKTLLSIFPREL